MDICVHAHEKQTVFSSECVTLPFTLPVQQLSDEKGEVADGCELAGDQIEKFYQRCAKMTLCYLCLVM